MRRKPFSQLFDSENNQILDPVGLAQEMFPGQAENAPWAGEGQPAPRPDAPRPGNPPAGRRSFVTGGNGMNGGHTMAGVFNLAQGMAGQQGAALANAAQQAQSAWQDENDSRVAQMRELQRQEHEKELMRMRMEAQRRSDEAALIRSILGGM